LNQNFVKPIKGSKDADFRLVSSKNLSEILPQCGWTQSLMTSAKKA